MKLITHLPLEVVNQNEALQGIKCEKMHYLYQPENKWGIHFASRIHLYERNRERKGTAKVEFFPALTIADVIDNAEELFGVEEIEAYPSCVSEDVYSTVNHLVSVNIVYMCQQNKSIEEISKYITDNLK